MAKKPHMVTLREASVAAGVSISALRKWYNAGLIDSELVEGPSGEQRVVDLDAVKARAARIHEDRSGSGVVTVPTDVWRTTVAAVASNMSGPAEVAALRTEVVKLRADVARLTEVVLRTEAALATVSKVATQYEDAKTVLGKLEMAASH